MITRYKYFTWFYFIPTLSHTNMASTDIYYRYVARSLVIVPPTKNPLPAGRGCFVFIIRRTFDDVTEALETRYKYLATRAGDYFRYGLHACHSCGFSYN